MKSGVTAMTFLILVLAPNWVSVAQMTSKDQNAPPKTDESISEPSPSATDYEIEDWLNENGKELEHLVRFGVDPKVADAFTSEVNNGILFPKWAFARTGVKAKVGVLFLPCNWEDFAYVFTLRYEQNAWRVKGHEEFDCHYDDSVSMEIVQIRDPNLDEILIHQACVGRGTGYLEQSFTVFLPIQGKLKSELETDEILHSFPTVVKVRHDLDQRSTFTVIPIGNSRSRAIEETRSSTLNDHLTVQRRVFYWNPAKERYTPSAFTKVEAVAN